MSGVIRDASGNLYGTTQEGGAANLGVVFEVNATGHYSVLHSFIGGNSGASPSGGLVQDSDGNLYGVAGAINNQVDGVLYKLDASRNYSVLYTFAEGAWGSVPLWFGTHRVIFTVS